MDFEKLAKIDLSYPGISFGYHSWALRAYIESLEEFISSAANHYRVSAREKLEQRADELHEALYFQELVNINEAAKEHIPNYARMSVILFLWGIFEFTVNDIISNVTQRESVALKFRDIRGKSLSERMKKYFECVLGIDFPWSKEEVDTLEILNAVRDAIAHRNGQYKDASPERIKNISDAVRHTPSVEFRGGRLVISEEYVSLSADLVFSMLENLNEMISTRYDGPVIDD